MKKTAKQRTIVDTELYNEINSVWKDSSENEIWKLLFDTSGMLKNEEIPYFQGGLDHIEKKNNGFWFYDIGTNHGDNTFCITKKSNRVTTKKIIEDCNLSSGWITEGLSKISSINKIQIRKIAKAIKDDFIYENKMQGFTWKEYVKYFSNSLSESNVHWDMMEKALQS
jgi:hypothetical protein